MPEPYPVTQFALPKGGQLFLVNHGGTIGNVLTVVFDIGNGVKVYYDYSAPGILDQLGPGHFANYGASAFPRPMTSSEFYRQSGLVHGGMVQELQELPGGKSFQDQIEERLKILSGGNDSWIKNDEVRAILADAVVNNLSEDEILARVRQTDYWDSLSNRGREWEGASEAERQQMIDEVAVQLANAYFQTVGETIKFDSKYIRFIAASVAMGRSSIGAVIEGVFKKKALEDPESPWSREVRSERETQRQRGVDIENQTETVQRLFFDWGLPVGNRAAKSYAKRMVEKKMSEDDLLDIVKNQAHALYPNKGREVRTIDWAQPYMQLHTSIFEEPQQNLMNREIQDALQKGLSLSEAATAWRGKGRWMDTRNAHETLTTNMTAVAEKLGFTRG